MRSCLTLDQVFINAVEDDVTCPNDALPMTVRLKKLSFGPVTFGRSAFYRKPPWRRQRPSPSLHLRSHCFSIVAVNAFRSCPFDASFWIYMQQPSIFWPNEFLRVCCCCG